MNQPAATTAPQGAPANKIDRASVSARTRRRTQETAASTKRAHALLDQLAGKSQTLEQEIEKNRQTIAARDATIVELNAQITQLNARNAELEDCVTELEGSNDELSKTNGMLYAALEEQARKEQERLKKLKLHQNEKETETQ